MNVKMDQVQISTKRGQTMAITGGIEYSYKWYESTRGTRHTRTLIQRLRI